MTGKWSRGGAVLLVMSMFGCDDDGGEGERDAAQQVPVADAGDASVTSDATAPPLMGTLDAGDAATVQDAALDAAADAVVPSGKVEGNIVLANVMPARAADVAKLVGSYTGNVGTSAPSDGKPTRYKDSCTITVTSDGILKVVADANELSATMDGEELDVIASPNRDELSRIASAYRISGNNNITVAVHVLRGYVVGAFARERTLENTMLNSVSCVVGDVNPTVVGSGDGVSGDALSYGGATAADLASAWLGTYSNGTCSVEITSDGTLRLKKDAVDLSAKIAGDEGTDDGDGVSVYPSSISLRAGTLQLDGKRRVIKMQRVGDKWTAMGLQGQQSLVDFDGCKDMVKQ